MQKPVQAFDSKERSQYLEINKSQDKTRVEKKIKEQQYRL